ncbi:unnamed protein product [Eruca vesicaria subsp. sativa]|uniref:Bifunctional inhibitor/plant lipid transfer protein/seed storage helical domain-containing protein n=1 Tax=Eruca vesicaria subsp. sativa TaxID=29727 RepID=A0ABC8KIW8_ERUVS|nr:unnamed protein product [Eruca vesicaria subsp. sativa]
MKFTGVVCIAFVIVLVSALAPTKAEEKVACVPTELISCLPAYESGSPPSADCCGKLKEQEPCFCGYIQNPLFSQYVNSPIARKILAACGVPYPTC